MWTAEAWGGLGKLEESGGVKQEDDDGAGVPEVSPSPAPSSALATAGRVSTALAHVKRKLGDILAEASSPSPALGLPSLVTGPLPHSQPSLLALTRGVPLHWRRWCT